MGGLPPAVPLFESSSGVDFIKKRSFCVRKVRQKVTNEGFRIFPRNNKKRVLDKNEPPEAMPVGPSGGFWGKIRVLLLL